MGSLTIPHEGPIYPDASGFIYSVERIQPNCDMLEPMWRHAQAGHFNIVSSDLAFLSNPRRCYIDAQRFPNFVVQT